MEILKAGEVAAMLKVSKRQVYELCKERTHSGDVRENPLPVVKFGSSVRFIRADVEAWIERLARKGDGTHRDMYKSGGGGGSQR